MGPPGLTVAGWGRGSPAVLRTARSGLRAVRSLHRASGRQPSRIRELPEDASVLTVRPGNDALPTSRPPAVAHRGYHDQSPSVDTSSGVSASMRTRSRRRLSSTSARLFPVFVSFLSILEGVSVRTQEHVCTYELTWADAAPAEVASRVMGPVLP